MRKSTLEARRALVRWAWRMFRREWRRQTLVIALLTVAVAGALAVGLLSMATVAWGARGVVLNWTSTADNESGFRIFQSTDGTTFTAAGEAGSDATTFA